VSKIEQAYKENSLVRTILLLALTQFGKTGIAIEVAYQLCTHQNTDMQIQTNNVYLFTAMSDTDWTEQMTRRMKGMQRLERCAPPQSL
jgi:hypothetical protein